MAKAPNRICTYPGCGKATPTGRCEKHQKKERVDTREQSNIRGYDHRWRRLRAAWVRQNPLCVHCKAKGKVTPVQEVDHIIPFSGLDDPLRLDQSNLQSLCKSCHRIKTVNEQK